VPGFYKIWMKGEAIQCFVSTKPMGINCSKSAPG